MNPFEYSNPLLLHPSDYNGSQCNHIEEFVLEIKVSEMSATWKLNGGQKTWALTASGTVTSSKFHVSFDVQKITGRAPALKFRDGRLFQVDMTAEQRQAMALEIKAHCERHMNDQLMIILKSRPSL